MQKYALLRSLMALLYAAAAPSSAAPQAGAAFTPPTPDNLEAWASRNFSSIYRAAALLAAPPFRIGEVTELISVVTRAANELKGYGVPGEALAEVVPELVIWAVDQALPRQSRPAWLALLLEPETLRRLVKVLYKQLFPLTPATGAGAVIPPANPAPRPPVAPGVPVLDPATGEPL